MSENQKEYPVFNNYLLFKELGSDSLGTDYRAGLLDDRKPVKHLLLTEVYPFLHKNPNIWKRVNILLEGVKKSNIPKLYSPDDIVQDEGRTFLAYPLLKGRTLEQVLDDSDKKNNPINFDLIFSIALAIADLIDTGSSIVVSGEKSFHGFLTPDNIIVDYDGKIFLKNYGIYPYLNREEEVFNETVKRYGAWIAPEFLRKEKLVSQTDIYHLGYIIYRVLTGKYFSCSPDEDFDSKFSNISFSHHIPASDKDFFTDIITFFKKTLHPQPSQRFANIKEFKDYISNKFHIEELSSVTFNLAYYMNSLYLETMEAENKAMEKEMAYEVPEVIEEPEPVAVGRDDSHLAEDILSGLDQQEKTRNKLIIPLIAVVVVVIAVAAFLVIKMQQDAKEREALLEKERERNRIELAQMKEELKRNTDAQIEALKAQAATSEEGKASLDEKIKKLEDGYKKRAGALEEQYKEKMAKLDPKDPEKPADDTKEPPTGDKPDDKPGDKPGDKPEGDKPAGPEGTDAKQGTPDPQAGKAGATATGTPPAGTTTQPAAGAKPGTTTPTTITPKPPIAKPKPVPPKPEVYEGDLLGVNQVTTKPKRLKGKDPVFSSLLRRKYKGTRSTVRTMLLIDETGTVTEVKMFAKIPEDLKAPIVKALMKWRYSPAEKDKVKVKVWFPFEVRISL